MLAVVLAILIVPLAAGVACLLMPGRAALSTAPALTAGAGAVSFALVLALVPEAARGNLSYLSGYVRADAVSVVFLLATGFVYAAVAVYAAGYLLARGTTPGTPVRGTDPPDTPAGTAYARRFYAGFNAFAWAMLAAPLMGSLALLWIAVEVTTVVSALLVAIEDTDRAAEAAWKYVLIASAGLGLALLGTVFAYYAGAQVLGEHYDLAIQPLIQAGSRLPATPVRLAFGLAVLGYGTKVGLFPVHTWLPDAHSEAPTPVSALLSGSLLAVSFYAILRFYQVAAASLGSGFPRDALLAFGVASLLLASLYMFGQRDVKRLLAYSSVEHMGILAIGVSFGAPVALAGVLLHVMTHAAAKASAFMGAGVFTVKYGTKQMAAMRDGMRVLPWSGPLFLLTIFALSAFPPFGVFRSEFQIVAGGLRGGGYAAAAVLVILVTVAFFWLATAATGMLFSSGGSDPPQTPPADKGTARPPIPPWAPAGRTEPDSGARPDGAAVAVRAGVRARQALVPGEPSGWMVVPVLAGLAVLVLLGVHPPGELTALITRAAAQLGGAR